MLPAFFCLFFQSIKERAEKKIQKREMEEGGEGRWSKVLILESNFWVLGREGEGEGEEREEGEGREEEGGEEGGEGEKGGEGRRREGGKRLKK